MGLLEAMSAGLPCIGLQSCPSVNELIIDGQNGILCPDTPQGLANAIIGLIQSPGERAAMGRNARIWASQFHPEIVEMKWLSLIRKILDKELLP